MLHHRHQLIRNTNPILPRDEPAERRVVTAILTTRRGLPSRWRLLGTLGRGGSAPELILVRT